MPEEQPRVDVFTADPGGHSWGGILCPPRGRFDLLLLICVAGLLLVSAMSPADDSVQPDFSRHVSKGQRVGTASNLLQSSHVLRPNAFPVLITAGDHPGPVRHLEDLPVRSLPACLSSPGFGRSHAGRAPPCSRFC